jgi:hypothetical protein
VILRSTIAPKDSRVCSSTIETILIGHPKPFFAPKTLRFLVIDCPPSPRALWYAGRNPVADRTWHSGAARTRNVASGSWGAVNRLVALGGSLTPARAAGDYGCPPASGGLDVSIRNLLERDFSNSASAKSLLSVTFSRSRSLSRLTSSLDQMAACPARGSGSTRGESPLRRSSARPRLVTRQPRRQWSGRARSAFEWPVDSKH